MLDTLKNYALGADTQNVALLEEVFHETFRVVALTKDGIRALDKKSYLALIGEGKIGGNARSLEVLETRVDQTIGTAKLILRGNQTTFHDHLTLIHESGRWSIVSNVTRVSA
jgi:hypothetical protein